MRQDRDRLLAALLRCHSKWKTEMTVILMVGLSLRQLIMSEIPDTKALKIINKQKHLSDIQY